MGQLYRTATQRLDLLLRVTFLRAQCLALNLQPLQQGRRNRFFLAHWRQSLFSFRSQLTIAARHDFRFRGRQYLRLQSLSGAQAQLIGFFPAPKQQQTFCAAQIFGNRAIARRMFGLPGELRQLTGKLLEHIIHPPQIAFRSIQLQLGLMAALI